MARVRAPVAGVSRIGPVYTPPDRRNHGYGSAVTAAAAAWARQAGAQHVVLFTDLANPVSNAIYQRIGFQPVRDSTRIDFTMSAVWQQRGQTCVILGPVRPAQRTVQAAENMDNELRAATSARGLIGDAIQAPEIGLPPLPEQIARVPGSRSAWLYAAR